MGAGGRRVVCLGPWTLQSAEINEVRRGIQAGLLLGLMLHKEGKLEAGALAAPPLRGGEGRRDLWVGLEGGLAGRPATWVALCAGA